MLAKRKRAVASTTTQKSNYRLQFYGIPPSTSRIDLKERLGVLLLRLQVPLRPDHRETYLRAFEAALRHYVDPKVQGALL